MIIKSSNSLCNDYKNISELARATNEPIFITKEGEGDLVVLSMDAYEKINTAISENSRPIASTLTVPHIKPSIIRRSMKMTEFELGRELKAMYDGAPRGDQVAFIHLFGIRFADSLINERVSKREILKEAGLPESYQTEISKGVKLAKYVEIKDEFSV